MPRLILLGVRDTHVDALSHLGSFSGTREVLVVHLNPDALVLKLAQMAELPTATQPPDPRSDDVLVAPEEGNGLGEIVARWRDAGAAVRPLSWLREMEDTGEADTREEVQPEPPPERDAEEAGAMPTEEEEMPVELEVPAAAWSSPEATFKYLIHASGGPEAAAVLWWDGGDDHWVPWMWIGPEPGDTPPAPDRRIDLESGWGRFVLEAEGGWVDEVPRTALMRVAEDAAVRDLLQWERERDRITAAARDLTGPDRTVATTALEPLLRGLGATHAFLWQHREDSWLLIAARGEGIRLEGTLVVPESVLSTTFAPGQGGWQHWQPSVSLRLIWQVGDTDRRWPLRLARLETALQTGRA